jgi:hypothetical protein
VNSLSARFNHWRRKSHLERVARWEQTRVKGKARFVARTTLIGSGGLIIFNALWDHYVEGGLRISRLIAFLIAGPIVGLVSWRTSEGEFKAAKTDERARQMREQGSAKHGNA